MSMSPSRWGCSPPRPRSRPSRCNGIEADSWCSRMTTPRPMRSRGGWPFPTSPRLSGAKLFYRPKALSPSSSRLRRSGSGAGSRVFSRMPSVPRCSTHFQSQGRVRRWSLRARDDPAGSASPLLLVRWDQGILGQRDPLRTAASGRNLLPCPWIVDPQQALVHRAARAAR